MKRMHDKITLDEPGFVDGLWHPALKQLGATLRKAALKDHADVSQIYRGAALLQQIATTGEEAEQLHQVTEGAGADQVLVERTEASLAENTATMERLLASFGSFIDDFERGGGADVALLRHTIGHFDWVCQP